MKPTLALACALALAVGLVALPGAAQETAPEVDVRIVRDGYGVPHVYSDTQEGVAYGAGYAITVDRLFQMDFLRKLSKGRASEIFGPVFAEADAAARTLFYTDAERRAKVTRLPLQLQRLYAAYVDGVNARIAEVNANPSLLPAEYTQLGLGRPAPWDVTDSIAIADMLVETFGAGGGTEMEQAELLKFLQDQHNSDEEAVGAFGDVRWINDPASPVSIPEDFDWRNSPSLAENLPAKDWRRDARLGLSDLDKRRIAPVEDAPSEPQVGTLEQVGLVPEEPSEESQEAVAAHVRGLEKLREIVHFGSNAFITGPQRTASGGTVQLGGPQVGQFAPQIIAEFGLHSPANDWDMMGLTFAGSGPAVLIGRTPFFAWTTTTGNSDGGDIYVEQLGPEPETYIYEGNVERMDCRDEQIPNTNGAPGETARICRTRHGPIIATDAENGVAYSIRRSWFDQETGTIEGFFGANFVDSIEEFSQSINKLMSNHNMFYVDADGNYGYWHPGAIPVRADGTDVRLPQDGRFAATEWSRIRIAQEMPHAVNFPRGWLANWNNKPAVSWDNGDGANYGGVFRNVIWNELLADEPAMSRVKGEEFNKINATIETEFTFFQEHIVRAGRASDDEQIRAAAEVLATWDARRIDEEPARGSGMEPGDGLVDSEPGYSLWDDWRDIAKEMAFRDDLEDFTGRASDSMLLHVLDGADASLPKSRDYLNGTPGDEFLNAVMRENLDRLAERYGTDDISQWQADMPTQFYTRLNVRFYDCTVADAAGAPANACDDRLPGNVRNLEFMNRGTYNHLVEYRPGTQAGLPERPETGAIVEQRDGYVVEAESIISPGQSGFINQAGQQDPHYEDQHELYDSFTYKPMPLAEDDVLELGDGQTDTKRYRFTTADLTRYSGADRVGTAVAASAAAFEQASRVVIASAEDFPDALAAAPLAGTVEGPLLLVRDRLDDRVRAELERLGVTDVVLVGGPAAVSREAEADLEAAGLKVRRLAGADRFETAALVAAEVAGEQTVERVFVANGRSFPDALAAGPVAASLGIPIVLVERDAVPDATRAALEALAPSDPLVLGGEAVISRRVSDELADHRRLAGADRYATSVAVASFGLEQGLTAAQVHVATGQAFPDGLAAGATAGAADAVLVLVDGTDAQGADPSYEFIGRRTGEVDEVVVYGGESAVNAEAAARAQLAASQR
jgi:penicillin amidase